MGEVEDLPEPGIVPIDPDQILDVEDPSSFDEGPDLAVIEALAEEDDPSPDAPRPAPITIVPVLDAVNGLGLQFARRLDALQAILEREQRAEASRERVVDRLHAELQEYKQDLLLRVQRPIFVDLIQLHDDLGKMIESRASADAEPERRRGPARDPGVDPDRDRGYPLPPGS